MAQSVRNLGTPVYPRRFFAAIAEEFGDAVELAVVHGAAGPVSAVMAFYFRDQVCPYFAGGLPEARTEHAYDFMYWSLMDRATERGARLFDFGRSKRGTGAFDYKLSWGFQPETLHYQFHLVRGTELPNVNPLNRNTVLWWKPGSGCRCRSPTCWPGDRPPDRLNCPMEDLLFLAHRIPYPPNKGDKIRSWHLLRHLAARYRVHLGCFVDDAEDHEHEPVLRPCAESCILRHWTQELPSSAACAGY